MLTISFICPFFFLSNQIFYYRFLGFYESQSLQISYTPWEWPSKVYCGTENQDTEIYFYHLFSFLKVETLYTRGQWVDVSGIPESCCCCLFILLFFSFFFLSNFQTLKFFVTLFSGTVRPRRLKLRAHVDNGWMYRVDQNQGAANCSFIFSFFFLSNFQALNIFVTLFSGTVRPRRLKLCTHTGNEWMYLVYRNKAAAAYLSLYFSFSPIFKH